MAGNVQNGDQPLGVLDLDLGRGSDVLSPDLAASRPIGGRC